MLIFCISGKAVIIASQYNPLQNLRIVLMFQKTGYCFYGLISGNGRSFYPGNHSLLCHGLQFLGDGISFFQRTQLFLWFCMSRTRNR